jgi:hypothetical protein
MCFLTCSYELPSNTFETWDTIVLKSHDLTNSLSELNPQGHPAKLVFRLTVPLIMKVFNLSPIGIQIVQYVLGYLLIIFAYKISLKILNDSVSATFIALGIMFTHFGNANFYDGFYAFLDGWSYFFIIMAMYSQNVIGIFFFATCAAWNDERAFIALAVVLLFHQINTRIMSKYSFKELISLNSKSIAVLAAITSYLCLRLFLQFRFGMHTPLSGADVGLAMLRENKNYLSLGIWTFLEGFWLLFPLFILIAAMNKNYLLLTLILAQSIIVTLMAGCVWDLTRSGAYLMPVIFILVCYLRNHITIDAMRFVLLIIMMVCFMFPPYYNILGGFGFLGFPAPINIISAAVDMLGFTWGWH